MRRPKKTRHSERPKRNTVKNATPRNKMAMNQAKTRASFISREVLREKPSTEQVMAKNQAKLVKDQGKMQPMRPQAPKGY